MNAIEAMRVAMFPHQLAEIARLQAENERLRSALTACLDDMEQARASGDCGNWDWQEGDAYTVGRAALGAAR